MTTDKDFDIDELFQGIRAHQPEVSDTLMARILRDADEVQPEATAAPEAAIEPAPGLLDWLGGWVGIGGLVAACLVGLTIGITPGLYSGDTVALTVYDDAFTALAE